PNRRDRGAGSRAQRSTRQIRDSRDARGHHGQSDVGLHRRNVYMSPKKARRKRKIAFQNPAGASKQASPGEFESAGGAADFVFSRTKLRPQIALVLGSGLGAFAEEFSDATKIPYGEIPYFPRSTAVGHAGQLVIGKVGAVSVAGMQGRVHLYEGYSAKEIVFPVRVFARMGVKAVILTNAAGGIKREFSQGRLVVISDHINLQGVNPLTGPNDERFVLRFHDMTVAYDRRFREMAVDEGNHLEVLETAERVKGQFINLLKAVIPRIAAAIA